MKKGLLHIFLLFSVPVLSQTGPGGIGNSSSNVLWLDGSRGISTAGSAVLTWYDQSGNNNAAYSGTIAQQPQVAAADVNGFSAIRFDGTNDFLSITDHATLDLQQWHVFIVVRVNVHKNYNTWFSKGTYLQENYCLLSYANGNVRAPIRFTDGNITVSNTIAGQVTTTEYSIIEYSYSPAEGRDIYKNNSLILTDDNDKIPAANNASLVLGFETGFGDRYLNGNIAEIIIFNERLNTAQRFIINNYLAAKYDKTLVSNDFYDEDNMGYDYEVAGIGRLNAGDQQSESQGTSRVRILNPTDLDDNEFLLWGHDNGEMMAINFTDVPVGVEARSERIWRVSERNAANTSSVDVGNVDMRFDLTALGPVTQTDLRLLIDTDDDGIFADETPIAGAVSLGANVYQFAAVQGSLIADNRSFTIATINSFQTPLPIELLAFNATVRTDFSVMLDWQTASEVNNDFFTVERSTDGAKWSQLIEKDGAGNSSELLSYQWVDDQPMAGDSYYRLKQTDFNGDFRYSEIRKVNITENNEMVVFPNPFVESITVRSSSVLQQVSIYNTDGRVVKSFTGDGTGQLQLNLADLPPAVYIIELKSDRSAEFTQIVKH